MSNMTITPTTGDAAMTNEHTAALKRALDSVRNAREALRSIGEPGSGEAFARFHLTRSHIKAAEKLLSDAIDEESKG